MILEIQHSGLNITAKEIKEKVFDVWKKSGRNKKDIKSTRIYYIPEKASAYFVINEGELTGDISFASEN